MTKILLSLAATVCAVSAAPIQEDYAQQLCLAIWAAEGKEKAKAPYGVLSVKTRSRQHAKAICLNTIRNSWTRFEAAGRPGDFIEHLGVTYCPTKGDKTGLNKHWVKNVRALMPPRKRNFSVL